MTTTGSSWEITCLIDQAVQTNRAESLLDDPDILQHISAQCLACSKTFRRRQDTSRHVKQGHPSEWAEVERMAADLATRHNPEMPLHSSSTSCKTCVLGISPICSGQVALGTRATSRRCCDASQLGAHPPKNVWSNCCGRALCIFYIGYQR